MSGVAGVFLKPSTEDVERMLMKLTHRGPDGQGIKNLPNGTLGHNRLAIRDVEDGHQPMGVDGTWITFDGEIYNYRELASDYLKGESFRIHTDTEVLLYLYKKFGTRCVELLDGMFVFAILDRNGLFIARDPLGIKPLYCSERDGVFYFASEVKALAEMTNTIHEFPAGHWFHSQTGWRSYFDIDSLQKEANTAENVIESIRSVLKEAVRKRLLADVPVGISLSGGLNSSIVAMLANQESAKLHSFAVGMEGADNFAAARKMAGMLGTYHHERAYTEKEILAALPKVIYHLESFDPALVRSSLPNFFLAEMASRYVKVILTGEGADEIYAGYDHFHSMESPAEAQEEVLDMTAALHNTNLQRVDRIAMAFGLEARVPFLDRRSIALGLGLPAEHKFHPDRPAEHLLRRAFCDDLPKEIANRPKLKSSKGAGLSDIIIEVVQREISDVEFQSERDRLLNRWGYRLPNKEALYYYKLLREYYEDRWILPVMGQSQSW